MFICSLEVVFQTNDRPLRHAAGELGGLFPEELNGLAGIDGLRSVNSNEPNAPDSFYDDRVAIHNPRDQLCGREGWEEEECECEQHIFRCPPHPRTVIERTLDLRVGAMT